MQRNPFEILGVSESASRDELYAAYTQKRALYEEKRFNPGEEGAEACARLEEIEDAYNDACDILRERGYESFSSQSGSFYSETDDNRYSMDLDKAEAFIKSGQMDAAQKILDDCTSRSAKWHYLQSAIFYRKNWHADALKQLEFACNMEPSNTKYADAKTALETEMRAHTTEKGNSFYSETEKNGESVYSGPEADFRNARRGCTVCDCCNSLLCADCCCECMGGDLIRCC